MTRRSASIWLEVLIAVVGALAFVAVFLLVYFVGVVLREAGIL